MQRIPRPSLITLSNTELGDLYGMGKPTYIEGFNPEEARSFLGLQRNEYQGDKDLKNTLDLAKRKIEYLQRLLPKIQELYDKVEGKTIYSEKIVEKAAADPPIIYEDSDDNIKEKMIF